MSIPAEQAVTDRLLYLPQGNECQVLRSAYHRQLPLLIKGPTGCGKTRFVRHMAAQLGRPLITVSCHDELSSADLVGRFLIRGEETVWQDGPLTRAVREGAICYLDEVVEARKDTTVILHPLTDDRRELPLEKTGEVVKAPPEFMLVISYNPGYQNMFKNLKPSTRQRFVALTFSFPKPDLEAQILEKETAIAPNLAKKLVSLGGSLRALQGHDLEEVPSTRLLVHAASLITEGLGPAEACRVALVEALSDDPLIQEGLWEIVQSIFPVDRR